MQWSVGQIGSLAVSVIGWFKTGSAAYGKGRGGFYSRCEGPLTLGGLGAGSQPAFMINFDLADTVDEYVDVPKSQGGAPSRCPACNEA
jgi:hypothetical protein